MKTQLSILVGALLCVLFTIPSFGQLKVDATGNVGIKTSTPSQALEVNGQIRSTGKFIMLGANTPDAAEVLAGFQRTTNGSAAIRFYASPGNYSGWGTTFGLDASGGGLFHKANSNLVIATQNTKSVDIGVNNGTKIRVQGADGFVGINMLSPAYQLHVNGDAAKPGSSTWIVASDKRLKKDIKPFSDGLEQVLKINPVYFKYNGEGGTAASDKEYVGVIAQDMQRIAPYTVGSFTYKNIVATAEEGKLVPTEKVLSEDTYLSYDANAVTYMLVNAIKEQQKEIEARDAKIAELESRMERLEQLVLNIGNNTTIQTLDLADTRTGFLLQNQPNPFNQTTVVRYQLPENVKTATLRVVDINGRLLKEVKLNAESGGQGDVLIQAGELSPGTYSYSLIVDGRIIETRQMALTR